MSVSLRVLLILLQALEFFNPVESFHRMNLFHHMEPHKALLAPLHPGLGAGHLYEVQSGRRWNKFGNVYASSSVCYGIHVDGQVAEQGGMRVPLSIE